MARSLSAGDGAQASFGASLMIRTSREEAEGYLLDVVDEVRTVDWEWR